MLKNNTLNKKNDSQQVGYLQIVGIPVKSDILDIK